MADTITKIDFSGTKADELELLEALLVFRSFQTGGTEFASHYAKQLGMDWKRCNALLLKWADKRWWEYGVSPRSGWFTELGLEAARQASDLRAKRG